MRTKWEYRALKLETGAGFFSGPDIDIKRLEAELNELGEAGWEVVATFDIQKPAGSKFVNVILKRRRDD